MIKDYTYLYTIFEHNMIKWKVCRKRQRRLERLKKNIITAHIVSTLALASSLISIIILIHIVSTRDIGIIIISIIILMYTSLVHDIALLLLLFIFITMIEMMLDEIIIST